MIKGWTKVRFETSGSGAIFGETGSTFLPRAARACVHAFGVPAHLGAAGGWSLRTPEFLRQTHPWV